MTPSSAFFYTPISIATDSQCPKNILMHIDQHFYFFKSEEESGVSCHMAKLYYCVGDNANVVPALKTKTHCIFTNVAVQVVHTRKEC